MACLSRYNGSMSAVNRNARAQERRSRILVRRTTLDDDSDPWPVRGVEAISLVTRITRDVWNLSGKTWPSYDRKHIPIRSVPHLED